MLLNSILFSAALLVAEPTDTLSKAIVIADRGAVVSRVDTISISNPQGSIVSLTNSLPGLLLSDYGGVSGGKTISLRGLGASHTAIYVDGLKVSNLQTGQSDLGLLDLGSFGRAFVDYAQNSVSFQSLAPVFSEGKNIGGAVSFHSGSFGTYTPGASIDLRLSPRVSLRTSVGGVFSEGDFRYGSGLRRKDNDIKQVRGGFDFFGSADNASWRAKAYINSSDRGTPGSVSYPSEDRQRDLMSFVQGSLHKRVSGLYSIDLAAKGSWDRILFKSAWGDSDYHQSEYQLHSTHSFNINRWLTTSIVAGASYASLDSDMYNASRWSSEATATASCRIRWFSANLELAYNGYYDRHHPARNYFTPSADLSFTVFRGFKLVGFARRAPRVPNFNELYYVGYGNPDLKAEDAFLSDVGVEYRRAVSRHLGIVSKIDGFHNVLKDKITSAPTAENPNIWLPFNIGKVLSSGLDASFALDFAKGETLAHFTARYSFQNAEDRTRGSSNYGSQIPYVARHSLYLGAKSSYRLWSTEVKWTYRASRRDSSGPLPRWNTLDLSFGRELRLRHCGPVLLKVDMENLCSQRYELVRDYPMPSFSITGGVEFKF